MATKSFEHRRKAQSVGGKNVNERAYSSKAFRAELFVKVNSFAPWSWIALDFGVCNKGLMMCIYLRSASVFMTHP